jgi:NAD(P) transhydrogenase subunit alpha
MNESYLAMITIFILSAFVGLEVIKKVSPLLHTPLMSLTNAISAITVVGAILVTGSGSHQSVLSTVLGGIAVFCAMTNIVSGFLITDRMLKMFKKREGGKPDGGHKS